MKGIDIGPGYDRLSEAMEQEGVFQIRWYKSLQSFTVELEDGSIGWGKTPRDAMSDAQGLAVAA